MPEAAIAIGKLLLYASLMGALGEPEVGVGAYYAPGLMQRVCERRVENGWSMDLDCSWPCLVSGIEHESLGEYWFVDLPGESMYLCLVVDVGRSEHLEALRARGEIVELPHWLAMKAGWDGYKSGVKVWRLER